jgi:2-iminobutanoate/2-iminopropanoate deaminase
MARIKRIPTPFSYSAAVVAGNTVYLGLHRGFAEDFTGQCERALEGIRDTLSQLDLGLENLVKVNVWLKNISDLPAMEKLFHNYFEKDGFPARMTSTTEFIDDDCLIMIEGVAFIEE